jgi:outer membrane protein
LVLGSLVASLCVSCTSSARHGRNSSISTGPSVPWTPPADAKRSVPADTSKQEPSLPKELLESKANWTLVDIVDVALGNNPATRASWAAARSAAANLGSEKGAYYPQLNGYANYSRAKNSFSRQLSTEQTLYLGTLDLTFTLFDFGKTRADVQEARQALYGANWTHNAMIQEVILEVERQYYGYLYAKSVRETARAAVKEAEVNLDAAEERHKAGLATVADVLQARSNHAQKRLALQAAEGEVETIRGSLATAMGLPPNIDYDVGFLPEQVPVTEVSVTVDTLLREAEANRPDLAAMRASFLGAKAHVRSVKAGGLPKIYLRGNASRGYYDSRDDYADTYLAGVFLSVPLFTGFSQQNDVVDAESKAEVLQQRWEALKSQVGLEVWTSYYGLKTAGERVATTDEFLASATESHDVALERYKAGVGSILELLAAQTALEDARGQSLEARTDWLLSLSELAYATGRLEASAVSDSMPPGSDKDGQR